MYLSKLIISNFRAIKHAEIPFQKGVNIIIGENNSGKSTIIDVLRICLGYGKSEIQTLYIKEADLHINRDDSGEANKEIQFDLVFEIDPKNRKEERQAFFDFLSQDPENESCQTIQLHFRFSQIESGKKTFFKRSVWGGDNEGQTIPYEALEEIFFVYLDPLRDAISSLKPYSYQNKVGMLFNQLTKYKSDGKYQKLNEEKKSELADKLYEVFRTGDWKNILKSGNDKVNDHLEGTGIKEKYPNIEMSYVGRKYSDVVKGIEIKRPIFKDKEDDEQKYFEIYQNGLGENNLIYTSVVLGDLINRCEDPELELYNALLVEEPEAHLHPQLQNRFFSYLNNIEDKGAQVFITSHSPTITAKTNLDKLIVLQKQEDKIAPFAFSKLTKGDFSPKNRDFLKKFLDVTKSQLFFANGVILVEGLAEALLLPTLAKVFLEIDLEAIGIEIVNINGVGFEHFAKLFNNKNEEKRMLARCAIITDSDPTEDKEKSDRAQIAENLEGENLLVRFAKESFEFDLFQESDKNATIMREVYRDLHPLTEDLKSEFDVSILRKKLNKSFRDKGDFALALQAKLSGLAKNNFDVPKYIKEAVNWVVKKDKNV